MCEDMDQESVFMICMREVTSGPEIESEVRHSIDLRPFLIREVTS